MFSKRLHDDMETAAVAGSYASVIGGAPAAAVVFAREVSARTENDPRVAGIRAKLAADPVGARAGIAVTSSLTPLRVVRAEKLKQVADEFDSVHDIRRAAAGGVSGSHHPGRRAAALHHRSARAAAGYPNSVRNRCCKRDTPSGGVDGGSGGQLITVRSKTSLLLHGISGWARGPLLPVLLGAVSLRPGI